jgi:uncharacterized protein (DUF58 family)
MYLFENNAGTRIALASVALLPPLLAAPLLALKGAVTAELNAPETLERGGEGLCRVRLVNAALLPVPRVCGTVEVRNLTTGEGVSVPLSASLPPRGQRELTLSLDSLHSGKLCVRLSGFRLLDVFGVFSRRTSIQEQAFLLVPPVSHPVELTLADRADDLPDSQEYSALRPGLDPSETFRIREYVPGDPIRQIHWKLSEKTGQVMVRDFGLPVVQQVLLLESQPGQEASLEALDNVLDLLVSFSHALLAQDIPHTVAWPGEGAYETAQVLDTGDLTAALERLLGTDLGGESWAVRLLPSSSLGEGGLRLEF